jgi:hypothetical protein
VTGGPDRAAETLLTRPRLEQYPVHGELLVREQALAIGMDQHNLEKRAATFSSSSRSRFFEKVRRGDLALLTASRTDGLSEALNGNSCD